MFFNCLRLMAFLLIITGVPDSMAYAEGVKKGNELEHVSNKILVKFYTGVTDEKKAAIRKELGAELIKRLKEIRFEVWKLPEGVSMDEAVRRLKEERSVECSEPDYIYTPQNAPGDSNINKEAHPEHSGKKKTFLPMAVKWNEAGVISWISTSLSILDGRRFIPINYDISLTVPKSKGAGDIFQYALRAFRFPAVILSCLIRGFGFIIFAVVASFGYMLPFALFFLMSREQKDEDEIQADK
jgi:hypothetical protein